MESALGHIVGERYLFGCGCLGRCGPVRLGVEYHPFQDQAALASRTHNPVGCCACPLGRGHPVVGLPAGLPALDSGAGYTRVAPGPCEWVTLVYCPVLGLVACGERISPAQSGWLGRVDVSAGRRWYLVRVAAFPAVGI
jgi:hypothetical protein